jgi:uncharacterized membrane protein
MFSVAIVGATLLISGMWPLALVVQVVGTAVVFHLHGRAWKKKRAAIQAAGITPDFTAWETRLARRGALLGVAMLMLMFIGTLVLAIAER